MTEHSSREGTDGRQLVAHARDAMQHAHAPYSRFRVGAAVLDDRGRVFSGANVENASYGLSMCAERVAIFAAVASGARRIVALAVTAERVSAITPCGACRQVIAEFCDTDTPVFSDAGANEIRQSLAGDLLPHAFDAAALAGRPPPTR